MSRIAKNPIVLPQAVTVEIQEQVIQVKGPKGLLSLNIPTKVGVKINDSTLQVIYHSEQKQTRCLAGTFRANLSNILQGVSKGFSCTLVLVKVGARAQVEGDTLIVIIGFSNPKRYTIPESISIKTTTPTEILIEGIEKQKVFQTASEIIQIRPAEPYKGTGILKKGQKIKLKAAKKK